MKLLGPPGSREPEDKMKIWADTTIEALEAELKKVIGRQPASQRSNPKYVAEVNRLRKAIAARKSA